MSVDPQLSDCIFCALSMCDDCLYLERWCGHPCGWLVEESDAETDL